MLNPQFNCYLTKTLSTDTTNPQRQIVKQKRGRQPWRDSKQTQENWAFKTKLKKKKHLYTLQKYGTQLSENYFNWMQIYPLCLWKRTKNGYIWESKISGIHRRHYSEVFAELLTRVDGVSWPSAGAICFDHLQDAVVFLKSLKVNVLMGWAVQGECLALVCKWKTDALFKGRVYCWSVL